MAYFVYRAVPNNVWPENWELVSKHDDLDLAEKAARKLCRAKEIHTEPGHDLERAFFGPVVSNRWSAMIDTRDIHRLEK